MMASWMRSPPPFADKAYDLVELFAGTSRIARLARAAGWHTLIHDWDFDKPTDGSNNAMDMNGSAGFMMLGFIDLEPVVT